MWQYPAVLHNKSYVHALLSNALTLNSCFRLQWCMV